MDDKFTEYMKSRNLAEATQNTKFYALKRIERTHDLDLDEKYNRDRLANLLKQLSYSADDETQSTT